jgi:uncharacterized secreted protein with C-terminal beta-propeller domain
MFVTAAVASSLALSGCSATARRGEPALPPVPGTHAPTPAVHRVVAGRPAPPLATFGDCKGLLAAVKREAETEVGAYGLPGGGGIAPPMAMMGGDAVAAAGVGARGAGAESSSAGGPGAPAMAAPGPASPGFSTTNNQEAGVDEPDLAKTDGHLMVLVRHQPFGLQVMKVDGDTPRKLGFLDLGPYAGDAQLFLAGSLAIVLGPAAVSDGRGTPETVATVVSLTDPTRPAVVRTFRVPGDEVDARMLAGRVVLVVQRWPTLPFRSPGGYSGSAGPSGALAANRTVIARSRLADWLPPVTTTPGHRTFAPACDATWHAAGPQGLGTVTVVSFDPKQESSVRQTTVIGNAGTVYASSTDLFLATSDWHPVPVGRPVAAGAPMAVDGPATVDGPGAAYVRPASTQIHAFDLHDPAAPRYVGSGTVAGQIVDQYSLSEYHGDLRVATTVGTAIPAPGEGEAPKVLSDSRVTVLRPLHGALVQVGQVRGLGRGERIYGVRFLDDIGYVVTFRQIDPLFVLDLSDPAHPREVGRLKVTGYSAYLHPLGDGLLFGLGRRVDSRAHPIGEQLSVFDVSTPADPTLRSRVYVNGGYSPAEDDHHAFLWWAKDRLVILPMSDEQSPTTEIAVYHVTDTGVIGKVGAVQPPTGPGYVGIERSLVIGGVLYVVSDGGVLASDLHSLKRVAWIPFR